MDSSSSQMRCSATQGTTVKNSRRTWSAHEEKILASALKEFVVQGGKCDNGFRPGYLNALEQSMKHAIPGTDLRAEPHISSRIHVWKKNYGSIKTMRSRSGFGWNDATHNITVDSDQVWNDYVKTDSNARTMRNKSWPLYNDWCEIFGNDRATGEHAEACGDVAQEIRNNDKGKEKEATEDHVLFNHTEFDEIQSMPVSPRCTSVSGKTSSGKRKSTHDNDMNEYVKMMGSFFEKTDSRLGDMVMRIGFEHDALVSRKSVFEALREIGSVDMEDTITIAKLLVNNTKDLDLFFSLPTDGKKTMVNMMLDGRY